MQVRRFPPSAVALLAVVVGSSLDAVTGWRGAAAVAGAAFAFYTLRELPRTGRRGRAMLVAGGLVALACLLLRPDPLPILARALDHAAALAGLFTALGFLREAAESSPLVCDCGGLLVRQPPGRRYMVLSWGSHMVALVLNFGVLSLLGTMVVRGNTVAAAGGDDRVVAIRTRRMMTALLRGFATMTVWSPLSVSFAVTQTVVHGLPWSRLLPLQMGLALLLQGLGWLLDRAAHPATDAPAPPPGGWGALVRLGALIAAVVATSVAVAEGLGLRLTTGAVLVVPWAALAWLAAQHGTAGPAGALAAAGGQLARRLAVTLPNLRDELAMVGGAMFFGGVLAAFVTPDATARLIGALGLPPLALTVLLAWAVMALAQLGLSQIVTVTLLGSALADLGRLGVDPLVLASGLMGAWALSACSTPVGAAILTIARLAEVPVGTVARDWNGRYVLGGALLLAAWMAGLQALLPHLG